MCREDDTGLVEERLGEVLLDEEEAFALHIGLGESSALLLLSVHVDG